MSVTGLSEGPWERSWVVCGVCWDTGLGSEAASCGMSRGLPGVQAEDTGVCAGPGVLICWRSNRMCDGIRTGPPKQWGGKARRVG